MSNVVAAVTGSIEAYRGLVQLTPVVFEGEIERVGAEIIVRGPGGDARGRLSAAFLLGAQASARLADPAEPTLRFHADVLSMRQSGPVYQPVSSRLADVAIELHREAGHGDEPLFLLRQATMGCSYFSPPSLSEGQLAAVPRELVERATTRHIEVPEGRVAGSTLAKKVAPLAEHDDALVRHECGLVLAWVAGELTNTSPAALASTFVPALRALWASGPALVEEQATLVAELFAFKLANEAQSWRVSQKKREAAAAALGPLARELLSRNVERREQGRRLSLDGVPLPPPDGTENGPWKKEVLEARAVRTARGLPPR